MRSTDQKYTQVRGSDDGVGARQMELCLAPEGGRYPDICTDFELHLEGSEISRRRFQEFRSMGLSGAWQQVAARIGVESFLEVWQMLDAAMATSDDRRVHVPKYSRYEKHQRNLLVRSLADTGLNLKEIQIKLFQEGYSLSIRSIDRIIQD